MAEEILVAKLMALVAWEILEKEKLIVAVAEESLIKMASPVAKGEILDMEDMKK